MSKDDINDLVFEASSDPDSITGIWNGNALEITYRPGRFGIDEMTVRVYTSKEPHDVAGRVATAFPESGPDVLRTVKQNGNTKLKSTT